MVTVKSRLEAIEKNTDRSELEVIIMNIRGFPIDEYTLTVGQEKEALNRLPNESEKDFVRQCESYALSKFKRGGAVPILFQKVPDNAVNPATGEPVKIMRGSRNANN